MSEKCVCHINGYQVKDAIAREQIADEAAARQADKRPGYILLGDSFGGGVTPGVAAADCKGWIYWAMQKMENFADVYTPTEPIGGVYGFASSAPFKNVLASIETELADKNITDIVVISGTNDIGYSEDQILVGISEFVAYCNEKYPNAKISIGCIGTDLNNLLSVRNAYAKCVDYGAAYIYDMTYLCCHKAYISSDGCHLTQEGYEFYSHWITNAVLTTHCDFCFSESCQITSTGAIASPVSPWYIDTTVKTNGIQLGMHSDNFMQPAKYKVAYDQIGITESYRTTEWYEAAAGTYTPKLTVPGISGNRLCQFNIVTDAGEWKGEGYFYAIGQDAINACFVNYGGGSSFLFPGLIGSETTRF